VTYHDDKEYVDDKVNAAVAENYDLNGLDDNIVFDLGNDDDNYFVHEEIDLTSVNTISPTEHIKNILPSPCYYTKAVLQKIKAMGLCHYMSLLQLSF